MNDQQIDELLVVYFEGEANPEEIRKVDEWAHASADNQAYFETMRNIWIASSSASLATKAVPEHKFHVKTLYTVAACAACLVLGFLVAGSLTNSENHHGNNSSEQPMFCELSAPYGSVANVMLPDSTKVLLNSGSRLKFLPDFGRQSERNVRLDGEALFTVKSDTQHPFIVSTSSFKITATGTQFNVCAYPDDVIHSATLLKGNIQVANPAEQGLSLVPGHTALNLNKTFDDREISSLYSHFFQNGKVALVEVDYDPRLFCSWTNGDWMIRNETLEVIARQIKRRFGAEVTISSTQVKDLRFSGTFRDEDLDQVMMILSQALPISYSRKNGAITISKK